MTNTKATATAAEPDTQAPDHAPKTRKRVWCILRLRDYCLTGLHPGDSEPGDFERIKSNLVLTTDREAAFQLARETGGLLCAAESLPRAINMTNLERRIDECAIS